MASRIPLGRAELDDIRFLDRHDPRNARVTIPRLLCEVARLRDLNAALASENKRLLEVAESSPRRRGATMRWLLDSLDLARHLRASGLGWKRLARIRRDEVARANREIERLRALYEPTVYSRTNPSLATLRAVWDELPGFLAEHGALLGEVKRLRATEGKPATPLDGSSQADA